MGMSKVSVQPNLRRPDPFVDAFHTAVRRAPCQSAMRPGATAFCVEHEPWAGRRRFLPGKRREIIRRARAPAATRAR